MAFTPPRFALFAIPKLTLMSCAMEYDLPKSTDGVQTANSRRNASAWIACSAIEHCRQNNLKQFARL